MVKQPVAGLTGASYGLADLLRGKGTDAALKSAVDQIERVNAWGGPVTERGQQRLGELGTTMQNVEEKVGGALGHPIDKLGETQPALAAGALGLLDIAGPGKGAGGAAKRAAKTAISKAKATVNALREPVIDAKLGAELANRYPETAPPTIKLKDDGVTTFESKTRSKEEDALLAARKKAQADIDKGNYEPYYDVSQRFHTDPARFPVGDTQVSAQPVKASTKAGYEAKWDTPEIGQRLEAAYLKGREDPLADRWYGMGQLVNDFDAFHGPEKGAQMFRQNFSHPMAATTAKASPEMNLMQSAYGNYLRTNKLPVPEKGHQMPSPTGSPNTKGNMDLYHQSVTLGEGVDPSQTPKRHNFAANFEGHTSPMTIDTRMMGAFDPSKKHAAPPDMSYGTTESAAKRIADKYQDTGSDAQAKMWVGLGDEPTKPMIQIVNEAIERTHRITGKPKEDIVRDSLLKGTHPLYQAAGAAGGTAALISALRGEDEPKGGM